MQHRPHSSRLNFIRAAIVSMLVGAAATVASVLGLAMWSPTRATIDPFPDPAGIADTIDPDGGVGLHGREIGFGWEYTSLRGERFTTNGKEDVIWAGPYGGSRTTASSAGPCLRLRSRVEVLDSQAANRFSEGQPEPQVVLQQRRRWELPAREILYRGIATTDLPGWTRAIPIDDSRLSRCRWASRSTH